MFTNEYFIVFPEGDIQEIGRRLRVGELVDMNGNPLRLPLTSERTIAYSVERIAVKESRAVNETYHYLSLMSADELSEHVR